MKQAQALDILKTGQPVFLTGQAGAGKTYVLNEYIRYLRQHQIPIAVTASTGIASSHMNGYTIHSWAGIGIKDELNADDLRKIASKKSLIERFESIQVLIIDEVSMLHANQLDMVDTVLRHFRKDERPFGGIQVVFSGDFFQLPPIGKKEETTKEKFAFMSKAWIALATDYDKNSKDGISSLKVCYLSEQHRQAEEENTSLSLNQILNQIREQSLTSVAVELLANSKTTPLDHPTRLYTHNAKVNEINESQLENLTGDVQSYEVLPFGDDHLVATLKKQILAPEVLNLKVGAKVMFVKNNPQADYYNGTIGEVIDFKDHKDEYGDTLCLPVIKTQNGRTVIPSYETWSLEDENGEVLASISQIPLCLAWAMTVHKSQGMTLDCAEIDLSQTFERGQGYVALSRVRSLAGLRLLGFNDKSFLLDDFAQVANRRFLALSQDAERWLANAERLPDTHPDSLTALQENFAQKNRTDYRPSVLDKPAPTPKAVPAQTDKKSSLSDLPELIAKKLPLDQLAQALSLAKMSVIDRLIALLDQQKIEYDDIAHLRPDPATLDKVLDAVERLEDAGEFADEVITLAPIYDELRETVSRLDIALSLLFMDEGADDE